jgi:RNA 2',3'-cyclic 3'-phosphodiesterase
VTSLRRAFVAVVPPDDVLDAVEDLVSTIGTGLGELRWTPRASWHVTLAFLGPVASEEDLARALRASVVAIEPAVVQLGGAGAFPALRRATTCWLGVHDAAAALSRLAACVRAGSGVDDDRPFRPHLTIARARGARDLRGLVRSPGLDRVGRPWTVEEVVLFESELAPSGAVHHVQARIALQG